MNKLYEYLLENYGRDEAVFLKDLYNEIDSSQTSVRQNLKRLTDKELLIRVEKGIYFIPRKSILKKALPDTNKVIERMFVMGVNNERKGYFSGTNFANMLGLTSQTASVNIIKTNETNVKRKALNRNDKVKLEINHRLVYVEKPKVEVTEFNYKILQSLDLLEECKRYSEYSLIETTNALKEYLSEVKVSREVFDECLFEYSVETKKTVKELGLYSEATS